MKKVYFVLLLLVLWLSLVAQEDIISILKPIEKENSLIEQLKIEKRGLAILEEEISYYYNLLQHRATVRELYKKGKISILENVFSKTAIIINRMFKDGLIQKVSFKISEQNIIYGDVVELKDQLLYFQAKLAFVKGYKKTAQELLEEIVENYPRSSIINSTYLLLEEIYFVTGLDQELINIFDQDTAEKSLQQDYWLAQAYYNTGKYSEAEAYFTILKKDKTFAFRSKAMLALISYFTDNLNISIEKFTELEKKYNKRTEYYEYILISLARLHIANNDFEKALTYYDNYYDRTYDIISDEVIYEIAIQNYNNKRNKSAIEYFNLIIDKSTRSQYFASAKFFVAVAEQGGRNYAMAEETLNEMITRNQVLMETMNTKYNLLEKYNKLRKKLNQKEISIEEKKALKNQMDGIEKALIKTNILLEELYTGLDTNSLQILQVLEEEYISYSCTIADMDAIILLAKSLPNKRIPAILDREIASSDSSLITLQILSYLGHKPRFSNQDYNFAKALATEKVFQNDLLNTWIEIEQIAIQNNHEEMLSSIHNSQKNLQDNLESIDAIAQYMFKGKPSEEFQDLIKDEVLAIEKNKKELLELKADVIKNFNKLIARRLNKEKEVLIAEFERLQFIYDDLLSELIGEVDSDNDQYYLSLLSILFRKTQIMDYDYKEFQDKVKNE